MKLNTRPILLTAVAVVSCSGCSTVPFSDLSGFYLHREQRDGHCMMERYEFRGSRGVYYEQKLVLPKDEKAYCEHRLDSIAGILDDSDESKRVGSTFLKGEGHGIARGYIQAT